jgi:hypothetical protein
MPGARSTKLETEKRIFIIQGWIIKGVPDYLILKNIQTQFKNSDANFLCIRQAKNLIAKAYDIWQKSEEATVDQKRSLRIAELKQDILGLKEEYKGTPRGMAVVNSIKKEITKLEALYHPKINILRGDKENPILVGDSFSAEKEARLKVLTEKLLLSLNK